MLMLRIQHNIYVLLYRSGLSVPEVGRLNGRDLSVAEFADGSINPRTQSIYYLFDKCNRIYNGDMGGDDMWLRVGQIEVEFPGVRVAYQRPCHASQQEMVIAILTPLMQRVHLHIRQSAEVMFVDTTSHVDLCNTSVTVLLTWTIAGAVPLGIILTYSQTERAFSQGKLILSITSVICKVCKVRCLVGLSKQLL